MRQAMNTAIISNPVFPHPVPLRSKSLRKYGVDLFFPDFPLSLQEERKIKLVWIATLGALLFLIHWIMNATRTCTTSQYERRRLEVASLVVSPPK